eukprot:UN12149
MTHYVESNDYRSKSVMTITARNTRIYHTSGAPYL